MKFGAAGPPGRLSLDHRLVEGNAHLLANVSEPRNQVDVRLQVKPPFQERGDSVHVADFSSNHKQVRCVFPDQEPAIRSGRRPDLPVLANGVQVDVLRGGQIAGFFDPL